MLFIKLTLVAFVVHFSVINGCNLVPNRYHTSAKKSVGDNGFRIVIGGNHTKYTPGDVYTVYLLGSRTYEKVQHFKRFLLSVQSNEDRNSPRKAGSFQLFKDSLAKFNENCINTISEENDLQKTEVYVMWTAPPAGSGCVTFRGMILENSKQWYSEDGQLSKEFCEQSPLDVSKQDDQQCCACDEAKYNVIFQGIWSNRTHPKDFPFSLWLTHFSDLIGAAHVNNFSFWGEGQIATNGFRSLAEWGSVRLVGEELSRKKPYIKHVFKAPGLWYPNVNTNTTARFYVDRKRHYVSLASMFGPSPDWFVGVNGLNLCLRNCSWLDNLVVDLYPWDAGTDSGITYMSPNLETNPKEKMYKITTMYPEDPRAPFYDPNQHEMQPLARFHFQREKLIPKSCDFDFLQMQLSEIESTSDVEEDKRPECKVSEYSDWSRCSVSCGKGLRMRSRQYLNPDKAKMFNCNQQLVSKEMCAADKAECPEGEEQQISDIDFDSEDNSGICKTTPWTDWSECSEKCGIGFRMKTRGFVDRMGQKKCPHIQTVEKEKCMRPPCSQMSAEKTDPLCTTTEWSDWSPCSQLCGNGVKVRLRLLTVEEQFVDECTLKVNLKESEPCVENQNCSVSIAKEICMQKRKTGSCTAHHTRWYFNADKLSCLSFIYSGCRGNDNNFKTLEECVQLCGPLKGDLTNTTDGQDGELFSVPGTKKPIDCVVGNWSDWSPCSTKCGMGTMERVRKVLVQNQNGGLRCPRLLRRRKCVENNCP